MEKIMDVTIDQVENLTATEFAEHIEKLEAMRTKALLELAQLRNKPVIYIDPLTDEELKKLSVEDLAANHEELKAILIKHRIKLDPPRPIKIEGDKKEIEDFTMEKITDVTIDQVENLTATEFAEHIQKLEAMRTQAQLELAQLRNKPVIFLDPLTDDELKKLSVEDLDAYDEDRIAILIKHRIKLDPPRSIKIEDDKKEIEDFTYEEWAALCDDMNANIARLRNKLHS